MFCIFTAILVFVTAFPCRVKPVLLSKFHLNMGSKAHDDGQEHISYSEVPTQNYFMGSYRRPV